MQGTSYITFAEDKSIAQVPTQTGTMKQYEEPNTIGESGKMRTIATGATKAEVKTYILQAKIC